MFQKVLIANRGEIAVRIIRACKDLGIRTVAVHSVPDADSMHVRFADESVCIGPGPSKDSYLNMKQIIAAALLTNTDAIHPGVGFLSENPKFAQMVEEHGITFIGPSVKHIELMGDKITAKQTAAAYKIPLVQGSDGVVPNVDEARKVAEKLGYPVLIKAASGGGGKGMKVATSAAELEGQFKLAQAEAKASFGNDQVYIEQYLNTPRHIEVQVLADNYGNVVHLGERDCSLQRRHQKIWEEAPSPIITPELRIQIGAIVTKAVKDMGYRGLGTVEFLYENGKFYFIEMNTRLQVEHPITEMITGIDLVQEQIKVAAGLPLSLTQDMIQLKGHSIECRINAENPKDFLPSPGKVLAYHAPGGIGVRVDSHMYTGAVIPPFYDGLIAKLIIHADTREECLLRLRRAIEEYAIGGVQTLLPLHRSLSYHDQIVRGDYNIKTLEQILENELRTVSNLQAVNQ